MGLCFSSQASKKLVHNSVIITLLCNCSFDDLFVASCRGPFYYLFPTAMVQSPDGDAYSQLDPDFFFWNCFEGCYNFNFQLNGKIEVSAMWNKRFTERGQRYSYSELVIGQGCKFL